MIGHGLWNVIPLMRTSFWYFPPYLDLLSLGLDPLCFWMNHFILKTESQKKKKKAWINNRKEISHSVINTSPYVLVHCIFMQDFVTNQNVFSFSHRFFFWSCKTFLECWNRLGCQSVAGLSYSPWWFNIRQVWSHFSSNSFLAIVVWLLIILPPLLLVWKAHRIGLSHCCIPTMTMKTVSTVIDAISDVLFQLFSETN